MKLYRFEFPSLWLGGVALIMANSRDEAFDLLVEKHGEPIEETWTEEEIDLKKGVKYYYNGNY